ncbi:hypothetical protein MAR_035818 [Mya arenaria]|uniref:Cadherin domain-containing protein n=2 Tax=Mya arenaria TaxID=6604 RepID=A0ABY7ENX5_MYAAR|nr:hypothetical protein MAR_035818 [Mya arenaria]
MFDLTATAAGGGGITYDFKAGGNPDSIAAITVATNVASINVATGVTLNYDTKSQYVLTIVATETADTSTLGTATVTINIGMAFAKGQFGACIVDGSSAGTVVGTYALVDVASGTTVAYTITGGNTNTDFTIGAATGQISLDTGKTVVQTTLGGYTLAIKGTVGALDHDTASVWISVQDSCSGTVQIAAALGIIIASLAAMHFI